MHNHCINKLLNIEEVIVKNVIHAESFVKIMLETRPKEHTCPACGGLTKRIHDYRMQTMVLCQEKVQIKCNQFSPICG